MFCDDILTFNRVLVRRKKVKSSKVQSVWPGFKVCKGFVVIFRRGCGTLVDTKLKIFYLECKLRWDLTKSECFRRFFFKKN